MSSSSVAPEATATAATAATAPEAAAPEAAAPEAVASAAIASATAAVLASVSTTVPTDASVTEASTPNIFNDVLAQQGLVDVSEADLMGLDSTPGETPAPPEPSVQKDVPLEPAVVPEPAESVVPEKPPKGFVPIAAIHEVRGENKYLKEQISQLTEKVTLLSQTVNTPPAVVQAPESSKFDDFVALTDEEFTALATDSPVDALEYVKQFNEFTEFKRQKAESERAAAEAKLADESYQDYVAQVFESTGRAMEQVVPGLLNPESPEAIAFQDFASSLGFTEELYYLTNPATQIILPDQKEPLLLGEHAAQIISVLAAARNFKPVDEAALTAKIRAELEIEILNKIKSGNTDFRSLSSIPQ